MPQTIDGKLVVRLRREGYGVVMSIPQAARQELCFRAGDVCVVTVEAGALVVRKVELAHVAASPASSVKGGE